MKAAILGFGTVGRGTYEALRDSDCGLKVKKVLDIYIPAGYEDLVTTDFNEILFDNEITVVAEAMGGLHPSYEYVTACLEKGKSVVSSNKYLICTYYKELTQLAEKNGCMLRYTPAVGGGIPWLNNLARITRLDDIISFRGIMNGTTNYILDAMQTRDFPFKDALRVAQELGYAEADPTSDLNGADARRKCAISANIAFDTVLDEDDIPTFGIENITEGDVAVFRSMGLTARLIAAGVRTPEGICAYVEPVLFDSSSLEASIHINYNCITLFAKRTGQLSFIGQGAGKDPTGCSLAGDMLDAAYDTRREKHLFPEQNPPTDRKGHRARYYIRCTDDLSGFGFSVTEEGAYITGEMSLEAIHSLYDNLRDRSAFIASIDKEVRA